ncbi:MAG: 1,2-phenylacetyl-CoA epoxidase, subunit C [Burkholderia gladioli]|nr:MAG: 1,2-phenylacetyl-CoA epoxidase, subunit C [Burkholderia gladioli]
MAMTTTPASHLAYVLRLADSALILGQRNAEWCGHGPILEEDIALTNMSLDLIGQARLLYAHAADLERALTGATRTEDDYAFFRAERDFANLTLVELPHYGPLAGTAHAVNDYSMTDDRAQFPLRDADAAPVCGPRSKARPIRNWPRSRRNRSRRRAITSITRANG